MQLQSDLVTPACPNCGDRLLAPEVSEFVDGGEIRHHWSCDSCGGESSTSIAALSQTLPERLIEQTTP